MMVKKVKSLLVSRDSDAREDGFSLVEIMIAAMLIAIIIIATLMGISSSTRASIAVENRSKALSIANSTLAVAQQAPYRELWVPRNVIPAGASEDAIETFVNQLLGNGRCDDPTNPSPSGTAWVTSGEPSNFQGSTGLTYCKRVQYTASDGRPVGTSFYVQTDVFYITSNGVFDNAASTANLTGGYNAKRVVVTVRWYDINNAGYDAGDPRSWNEVTLSYTKTPTPAECIPAIGYADGITWQGTTEDEFVYTSSSSTLVGCAP